VSWIETFGEKRSFAARCIEVCHADKGHIAFHEANDRFSKTVLAAKSTNGGRTKPLSRQWRLLLWLRAGLNL